MGERVSLQVLVGTVVCAVVVVITVTASASSNDNDNDVFAAHYGRASVSSYPFGDPRFCQDMARKDGDKLQRFEVLPGYGWDNLRNEAEGQFVVFNYSKCRTTEDARFLLPDSVSAVPIKASRVQTFAELITHWKSWTSITSKSVNLEAGLSLNKFSISGKFSADFEDIKSKQVGDKSVTTRTQLRYIRYGVQLQPDTPLHPVFKSRVLGIAAAEELGEKERARYLAQLLVRDFGTHVITKASAGAALLQVDQLREEWVNSNIEHKSDILAAASGSLFSIFQFSSRFESKTDQRFSDQYKKSRTSSSILTLGGPVFRPANFTPDMWADDVDRDLVAMDRSGDPIYYVLTAATLPELPTSTLNEVYNRVLEAVETYYEFNRLPGCLDPTSPNFSPSANTDDGSCKPPPTNLTFGGVFQTCSLKPGSNNGNLCEGLTQVNPLTSDYLCPDKYQAIKLHSGTTSSSRTEHVCKRYLIFWHKCHDDFYHSQATYNMYWCVATSGVSRDSGYLFGGLYTSTVVNPVTRAATCPPTFFPLSFGAAADLHICISDDYEFGSEYHLPFAGFISCQAGNPLAVARDGSSNKGPNQVKSAGAKSKSESKSSKVHGNLKMFFKDQADDWPKRCPDGYSHHLATVNQGCEISYCVRTGSMNGPVLPPIKRPPFMPAPALPAPASENTVIFDPATLTWKRNKEAGQVPPSAAPNQASADESMSPGTAAGISIGATLGCVVIATVAILAVRARRRRIMPGYRRLQNPLLDPQEDYGSVNTTERRPASTMVNVAPVESTP
nr:macrophage-expressed protein 1 [Charonia tritonis]